MTGSQGRETDRVLAKNGVEEFIEEVCFLNEKGDRD